MSQPHATAHNNSAWVPVAGLTLFALASGYHMSLLPLALDGFGLATDLAAWLASIFYFGLLLGATCISPVVARLGHRGAFILFLLLLAATVAGMPLVVNGQFWLAARFIAGIAVAGIFVVVESWLLIADTAKQRAKRLGFYTGSLYGGNALGQLGVGQLGVDGAMPHILVAIVLVLAVLPPLVAKRCQPQKIQHQKISFKEVRHVSRPAIMGCLVAGLVLGPIYGLMPVFLSEQTGDHQLTGKLMAIVILGAMLVQPLVSWLSPRFSKTLLMAFFCLLGAAGVVGILLSHSTLVMGFNLLLLGAAAFALYPIAITLACDSLDSSKIVAATELMLLSYSVGSVIGPLVANGFQQQQGLPMYLGLCLTTTCIYMLMSSVRPTRGRMPALRP
ncbi:MFS transporter [Shewanella chilikensis]|uniref:MFS transporter n=1 Tax=Shewanella chilikensis TaxID=558541 RepID=UPI003A983B64